MEFEYDIDTVRPDGLGFVLEFEFCTSDSVHFVDAVIYAFIDKYNAMRLNTIDKEVVPLLFVEIKYKR